MIKMFEMKSKRIDGKNFANFFNVAKSLIRTSSYTSSDTSGARAVEILNLTSDRVDIRQRNISIINFTALACFENQPQKIIKKRYQF